MKTFIQLAQELLIAVVGKTPLARTDWYFNQTTSYFFNFEYVEDTSVYNAEDWDECPIDEPIEWSSKEELPF